MENKIKVLWLDDQHEVMSSFKIDAFKNGIDLEAFTSFDEGFNHLEKNLYQFDVILLDGLFFEKKGQAVRTENERGLGLALDRIAELRGRNILLPWFILSGQASFTQNPNAFLIAKDAKCYDKSNPDDIEQLFDDIKNAAAMQPETQLRHRYSRVLELCQKEYLGDKLYDDLFELIKIAERPAQYQSFKDFTRFRKIIELLFGRLKDLNIIPADIIYDKGWINGSSIFLAGGDRFSDKSGYRWVKDETIHPTVGMLLKNLLLIIQDGSHSLTEKLNHKTNDFVDQNKTPYLFSSCFYMLMDILIWFKDFIDKNPDSEQNKDLWKSTHTEGTIARDEQNNYYCKNILLTEKVMKEKGFYKGLNVRIIKYKPNNNERTKLFFEYYALEAVKIE